MNKFLLTILFLVVFLFGNTIFGQTTGDYRSNPTVPSGGPYIWTTVSNWQYYNGSSWITATTYPGQNSGTYAVLVQAGHTITIGTSGITTQPMGTVTISGTLFLNANNSNTDYNLKTNKLIVTPNSGTINFDKKAHLILPSGAELQVSTGGLSGECNNNIDITIGPTVIAACTGGSPTFSTIMTQGGSNPAGTLSGNQYICKYGTNSTNFSSTVLGGTWSSSPSSIATVNSSGVVTAANTGTATITYTVGTNTATRAVYIAGGPGGGVTDIIGSTTTPCQNSSVFYTITSDPSNFSHTWSYTGSDVTFYTSADGRTATAFFGPNATSGNIKVGATNACGSDTGDKQIYVGVSAKSNGGLTTANGQITPSVSGCANTYIANIGLSGYIGTPIRWETSLNNFGSIASTVVGNSNNINASNLTQTTYFRAVVQNSPCDFAYSNICTVTINSTSNVGTVGSISGTPTVCQGQSGVVYSVTAVTNANSYNWSLPSGASIVGGANTNSITVDYGTSAIAGNITVQAINTCNYSTSSTSPNYALAVNPLPVTPGAITGASNVCQGQSNIAYSVPAITYANSYTWSYSGTGATITGSTNTPTISFSASATSGNLTVRGVNGCGNGAISGNYAITVSNSVPATPGTITQPTNKCASSTGNTFSITAVAGATSYTWSVSGTGWSVNSSTTTSATVTIGTGSGTVSVTATNACGTSGTSTTSSITPSTAPAVPISNAGTAAACNQITANWTASANATGYYLDVSTVNTFASFVGTYNNLNVGNVVTTNVTGLTAGTTYYYRVRAYNTCGTSASSTVITYATSPATPAVPTSNAGTAAACNQITANWTASANATGYYLDVSTVNTFVSFVGTYNNLNVGNVVTANVTGLTAGTTYYYRVRAYNTCGTSASSTVITYATLPATPAVPTSNAGTAAACTQITANWTASTNATGYYLDVSTVNTFASFVGTYNNLNVGNVVTANVTGLTAGTIYYYRVRAYNTCGTSASSTVITYATSPATPAVPTSNSGTTAACSQITANWTASANATGYYLDVSTVSDFASFVGTYNNLNVSNVVTANVTGLTAGTMYYYRVRAYNTCGTSASSTVITYATLPATPAVPTSNAGTAAACTQITANWTASTNATGYYLDVSTVNTFASFVGTYNNLNVSNVVTANVTGLTAGTTYYYRVRAYNTCGTSANSTVITYATLPATPAVPTSNAGTAAACTQITANWTASANATGYYLDVSTVNTFASFVGTYNNLNVGNVVTANVTGLTAGTTYYYRVRAYNTCGTSASSTVITYATLPATPAVPTSNAGTAAACTQITANWTASANATGYYLDVSTVSDFASFVGTYNNLNVSNVVTANVTGLTAGTMYYYRVRAYNTCGTSASSTVITYATLPATPAVPTSNAGTAAACTQITANWTASANATGYYLDVSTVSDFASFVGTYNNLNVSNVVTANVTGLTAGTMYYYRVRAYNTCGTSASSTVITYATLPATPAVPTSNAGTAAACTQITANWTASANATGYYLDVSTVSDFASFVGTYNNLNVSNVVTANVTGLTAGTTYYYRVRAYNTCGTSANSTVITYATLAPVAITVQPSASTICEEGDTSFSVIATGSGLTYQWQVSTNGGSIFNILSNSAPYSNTTTATMNITVATTAMTNYQYRCVVTGICTPAVTSNAAVLTVGADWGGISFNEGPYLASNSIVYYCPSMIAQFSIAPITGVGVNQYSWHVPGGWTILSGNNTNTITVMTGSALANSGSVSVSPANSVFCPSYIKVQLSSSPPAAITAISKIDPTCAIPTGTIQVAAPPVAGTLSYTLIKTSSSPEIVIEKNATGKFTGLTGGTYVVTYQINSGCFSDRSVLIPIVPLVTNTWAKVGASPNPSWSEGRAPKLTDLVVFDADYNETVSINSCSCVIKPNADVTIGSGIPNTPGEGAVLNIINGLNVDPAGSLTFNDKASLYQFNDNAVNSGIITYKRTTLGLKDLDYVYWSSPVAAQKLGDLYVSDRYLKFTNGAWETQVNNDLMKVGTGYIIRVRTSAPPFYQSVKFIGEPNNGIKQVQSQGDNKSNLIGNPYPSAVDADEFILQNQPLSGGTLYFWTHFTARKLDAPSNEYKYSSDDYATYNISGGTATAKSMIDSGIDFTPLGQIASGQSFFVVSGDTGGNFEFNNSMRFDTANTNSQFFKQSNTKKTGTIKKDRIWLNLTNDSGAFKQLLIGYITGATNDYDKLYDGVTRNGNAYIDFYSVNNSKNYTIQGRVLPFDTTDEVPLGYKTTIEGTFQINIDNIDGSLVNQTIYIEDKLTNTIHDLKSSPYSFTTAIGVFNDRFVLRYTNTSKLGTGDVEVKGKGVFVSVKNREIKINSFDQILNSVKVFDLKGSLLYEKNKVNKNEFIIDTLTASSQFMIVMVQLEDGKWISEEIIFHD